MPKAKVYYTIHDRFLVHVQDCRLQNFISRLNCWPSHLGEWVPRRVCKRSSSELFKLILSANLHFWFSLFSVIFQGWVDIRASLQPFIGMMDSCWEFSNLKGLSSVNTTPLPQCSCWVSPEPVPSSPWGRWQGEGLWPHSWRLTAGGCCTPSGESFSKEGWTRMLKGPGWRVSTPGKLIINRLWTPHPYLGL